MANTNGLSRELLDAVRRNEESSAVACGFCLQRHGEKAGFTVKDGPQGPAVVVICQLCLERKDVRVYRFRDQAESARAREELHRQIHLFAEDILADALTDREAPGITSTQTAFACQFPQCPCGIKDVAKNATHQTEQGPRPKLYVVRVSVNRRWRAFVACFTVARQINLRTKGVVQYRPLAECTLFSDREAPATKPTPSRQTGRVIGHIEPVRPIVQPSVTSTRVAHCSYAPSLEGNPAFKFPDVTPSQCKSESEVWEGITAVAERRREVLATHLLEGEDVRRLQRMRLDSLKLEVKSCLLHGPEFQALTRLLSALFDHGKEFDSDFGRNKPQVGERAGTKRAVLKMPKPAAPKKEKPLCKKCGKVRVKHWNHETCSQCTPKRVKPSKQKKGGGEKKEKGGKKRK